MSKFPGRKLEFAIGVEGTNIVAQVTALGEVGSSRGLIDGSAYGDDWMDYVTGQQDGDEVPITLAYDPADEDHMDLVEIYDGGEQETFHLIHEDAGFHVSFPALVTACSRGGARDGLLVLNATLKILNPGVEDVSSS